MHKHYLNYLYVLRDMNLIKYVGSNKTGHWEIIPKILMVN